MPFDFHCPSCSKVYKVHETQAGQVFNCQGCNAPVIVPLPQVGVVVARPIPQAEIVVARPAPPTPRAPPTNTPAMRDLLNGQQTSEPKQMVKHLVLWSAFALSCLYFGSLLFASRPGARVQLPAIVSRSCMTCGEELRVPTRFHGAGLLSNDVRCPNCGETYPIGFLLGYDPGKIPK